MFRLYSKSSFHLPSHIFFKFSSADPSEGDLNLSPSRSSFISGLTEQTKNTLKTDSDCFIHQSLSTPCLNVLKSCRGSYLKDLNGMKILDFHGNSVHQVGHRNKYVIKAIKKQMKKLSFCPRRYTNDPAIKLAQKLIEKTRSQDKELSGGELGEPQLTRVLFCPGGTSAMGIALKLARIATNRHKTLSMWDSFHGASLDCISTGGDAIFRKGIVPLMSGSEHVPPCDPFRCVFGCGGTCNYRCVDYVEYVFEKERDIGALIAEPIRFKLTSFFFIIIYYFYRWTPYAPPVEYWKRIRAICDKYGAKLIFDEIPNSLGRNGTTFFTYQMYGIVPDILVIGKGLGGGILPLAGILCKEELNEFGKEIALGHYTHEKNPVLCAAGLATIKYIEKYDLVNEAR